MPKKNPTLPSRPVRRLGIHLRFSLIAGSAMAESSQNHHQNQLNKMNIKARLNTLLRYQTASLI